MMMKCKKFCFVFFSMLLLLLVSCSDNSYLEQERAQLIEEIKILEDEKAYLEAETATVKEEKGTAKYIMTFSIKQSHVSLSIGKHIKDAMNEITVDIPVDKEYYDSFSVGDIINEDFRMGSFILRGSFGNWKVTVAGKRIG